MVCCTLGGALGGFPTALALAWTSVSVRTKIAGFFGGIGGVALAVLFGWGAFRLLVGSGSFTIWPFLAATLPLLLCIRNDAAAAQRVGEARADLLAGMPHMADETRTAHWSTVIGECAGLVLAMVWYVSHWGPTNGLDLQGG
jgi:hypothetical protein